MNEKRLINYLNKYCIFLLKNRLKYEGVLKEVHPNTCYIQEKILGFMEVENKLIGIVIPPEEPIK